MISSDLRVIHHSIVTNCSYKYLSNKNHNFNFTEHKMGDITNDIEQVRQRLDQVDGEIKSLGLMALLRNTMQGTGRLIIHKTMQDIIHE